MQKIPLDMIAGTTHKTKSNGELKVLKYTRHADVDVVFLGTGFKCNASAGNIRRGEVRDRLLRSVFGVGFWGVGIKNPTKHKAYLTWYNMIKRCYSEASLKESPTYFGCTVCSEWHNFQSFAKWFDDNYIEGFQLDKDIKIKGNTVYSKEACSFVSHRENSSNANSKSYRFVDPSGTVISNVNIIETSKLLGVSPIGFYELSRGNVDEYEGWTIISEIASFKTRLVSAANELKKLIDEKNKLANISQSNSNLSDSRFHDYQTCKDLIEIAKKI